MAENLGGLGLLVFLIGVAEVFRDLTRGLFVAGVGVLLIGLAFAWATLDGFVSGRKGK